ncbi:MAG: hypothetical protein WC497_01610 [Patescibacteria group bacterium]
MGILYRDSLKSANKKEKGARTHRRVALRSDARTQTMVQYYRRSWDVPYLSPY